MQVCLKQKKHYNGGFFNGASIEAFFEPFREMNIEELYATACKSKISSTTTLI